jgi:hypothetical protein
VGLIVIILGVNVPTVHLSFLLADPPFLLGYRVCVLIEHVATQLTIHFPASLSSMWA